MLGAKFNNPPPVQYGGERVRILGRFDLNPEVDVVRARDNRPYTAVSYTTGEDDGVRERDRDGWDRREWGEVNQMS